MNAPKALIEWRLYRSTDLVGKLIGWRSSGGQGKYTHVEVVDHTTGWLWGAHADSFTVPVDAIPKAYNLSMTPQGVHIPSGFFPRPPNYDAKHWQRVTAFRLMVSSFQHDQFWKFTWKQWAAKYDTRGLLSTYVLGRDWRDPGEWYCSEEQAAASEYAGIIRKLLTVDAVEPADFAELLNQAGATQVELPIPVPPAPLQMAA